MIGLAVINVNTGHNLGRVQDLLFDDEGRLRGIQLESKGLWRSKRYIPIEKILSIGEDALTVGTDDLFSDLDSSSAFHSILNGNQKLKGKPVITTNGLELGHVEDVYFQEEVGRIIGYELTDGFLSDVVEGRKVMPVPAELTLGNDCLVVPQEMEMQLTDQIEG